MTPSTCQYNGIARLRFFSQGIDQHVDCPENEAFRKRKEMTQQGMTVYRVDFYDDPSTAPQLTSSKAA